MIIERITKMVPAYEPSRSVSDERKAQRMIPMSLPRVRWLENKNDVDPTPSEEPRLTHLQMLEAVRQKSRKEYLLGRKLSGRENQCFGLHRQGKSVNEIAEMLGVSTSAIATFISNARAKLGET